MIVRAVFEFDIPDHDCPLQEYMYIARQDMAYKLNNEELDECDFDYEVVLSGK